MNLVVLVGNLVSDPELRYIPSGTAVVDTRIAVNNRIKKNEEWVEEATFVDVTIWGRTAEIVNQYLKKGSKTLVEGRLKLDTWENNDGEKRSKLKVVAERVELIDGKRQSSTEEKQPVAANASGGDGTDINF